MISHRSETLKMSALRFSSGFIALRLSVRVTRPASLVSLDEVITAALYFVVVISVQQKKSLIQSIKSKQIWQITLPDSIQKYPRYPQLFS